MDSFRQRMSDEMCQVAMRGNVGRAYLREGKLVQTKVQTEIERVFLDAGEYLSRYRNFITQSCQLKEKFAAGLTSSNYARTHPLFLLLFREIVRCQLGSVDETSDVVQKLSIATYGIFRSIVAMDALIDSTGDHRDTYSALESTIHHEAAIRCLVAIIGDDESCARTLRRLSWHYMMTHQYERAPALATSTRLKKILFRKSCMVLLPLTWAKSIYGQDDLHMKFRKGLIKLFVGLQLIDDLRDYDEDIKNGQVTLYSTLVKIELESEHKGQHSPAPCTCLRKARLRADCTHLNLAQRRLSSAIETFRAAGSDVMAVCVQLVYAEVNRVYAVKLSELAK